MSPVESRNQAGTEQRIVFAHRGLCTQAPENTMAAFRLAHEAGCTWIETDVDIIADGTPVILHDSTLNRTTDHSGSMYALSRHELPHVDAGAWFSPSFAGEHLPTLHEFIDFLNETGMNANIELKSHEAGAAGAHTLIDVVMRELARLKPGIEIIVSSFSLLQLAEFHRRVPNYPIGVLFEQRTLGLDWLSVLEICGASYVHLEDTALLPQLMALPLKAGYKVNVWTVDSRARANELFHLGATGVFTNVADSMLDLA
ncbi:glycerophosphodiester phosphodiesterase family protein [Changpingibacter yushuensis]|uniref:glycerophosphodiester phosphodiesterase family protein n=1 Tax=Changpingibacter yushuensis TaxID=2758440 RepID=UPI0015F5A100|nr:glycerophosphodiester phosphodiesterase family protein [Changpingibacter yushuensis]